MSSVAYASAGVSGALLEEGSRTALDSAQSELTISQMSRVFGVSLRTLRFYEPADLSSPAARGTPVIIGAATAFGWR
jgi:hypothetical protein